MISHSDARDPRAHRLDYAGALVPQDARELPFGILEEKEMM